MITETTGNLLAADADALVNTVNTEGVMGKGIALEFKKRFPDMYGDYVQRCRRHEVAVGPAAAPPATAALPVWCAGRRRGPPCRPTASGFVGFVGNERRANP